MLSYLIQVDSVSEEEHDATEAPVPLVGDLAAGVQGLGWIPEEVQAARCGLRHEVHQCEQQQQQRSIREDDDLEKDEYGDSSAEYDDNNDDYDDGDANAARAVLLPVRSVALYMHPQYSTYTS